MPGIMWYFAVALFFLLVVILSVPSDGAPLVPPIRNSYTEGIATLHKEFLIEKRY